MPGHSSSPQFCSELLSHPSINAPIVVFVLTSTYYTEKHKIHFEALRLRSAGATHATIGKNFSVGKSRGGQYVYHGLYSLMRLFEFEEQFRAAGDLVGSVAPCTRFFADGIQPWLKNRGIETWEQLASLARETEVTLPPQKRCALSGFVAGLSTAVLQSGLVIGPVLKQLTERFACDSIE